MIGFYDYTVVLTYLSLASAVCGSVVATAGNGHPYIGGFFLLICGLCDMFDGVVARSKKNRTNQEKVFGAQIDSLTDLIAFGILPGAIAVGLLTSNDIPIKPFPGAGKIDFFIVFFILILIFYMLTALIRLAYFNVLEEEHRHSGDAEPMGYIGLPVTMAALIFPVILMLSYFVSEYLGYLYLLMMIVTGGGVCKQNSDQKAGKKASNRSSHCRRNRVCIAHAVPAFRKVRVIDVLLNIPPAYVFVLKKST